jgi:hypothetical protein
MDDFVEKAFKAIFPDSDGPEIFCAYRGRDRGLLAGFDEVRNRRAKGDLMKAVLIYGFDSEERVRQHEGSSILNAPGVFYLRLPALLSDIQVIIQKAEAANIPIDHSIDEKSFLEYAAKRIRAFKHRLDNVCASMEMNVNRARNELKRSPGCPPRALSEIKSSNVDGLLNEYREIESVSLRLGIQDAEEISGMMEHMAKEIGRIENSLIGPSEAVASALNCVLELRRISDALASSSALYNPRGVA